ncbi:MAG: AbrB/MazE/SpoVT family DNA-binding domain-containing protein [Candidatus ainarchaeum sp.]|nr:AbrB/MazE/SpoVT family DNA-binding domain-containing protein [Candidatus ainarchaeum sp.]
MKKGNSMKKMNKTAFMGDKHFYGSTVVGERGQLVILKEARSYFGIKPGDKLIVLGKAGHGILLIKSDNIRELAKAILRDIG